MLGKTGGYLIRKFNVYHQILYGGLDDVCFPFRKACLSVSFQGKYEKQFRTSSLYNETTSSLCLFKVICCGSGEYVSLFQVK